MTPHPVISGPDSEVLPRLILSMMRRYSREPESRAASVRNLVSFALRLMAAETSPGETALAASETLADLARGVRAEAKADERRQG